MSIDVQEKPLNIKGLTVPEPAQSRDVPFVVERDFPVERVETLKLSLATFRRDSIHRDYLKLASHIVILYPEKREELELPERFGDMYDQIINPPFDPADAKLLYPKSDSILITSHKPDDIPRTKEKVYRPEIFKSMIDVQEKSMNIKSMAISEPRSGGRTLFDPKRDMGHETWIVFNARLNLPTPLDDFDPVSSGYIIDPKTQASGHAHNLEWQKRRAIETLPQKISSSDTVESFFRKSVLPHPEILTTLRSIISDNPFIRRQLYTHFKEQLERGNFVGVPAIASVLHLVYPDEFPKQAFTQKLLNDITALKPNTPSGNWELYTGVLARLKIVAPNDYRKIDPIGKDIEEMIEALHEIDKTYFTYKPEGIPDFVRQYFTLAQNIAILTKGDVIVDEEGWHFEEQQPHLKKDAEELPEVRKF